MNAGGEAAEQQAPATPSLQRVDALLQVECATADKDQVRQVIMATAGLGHACERTDRLLRRLAVLSVKVDAINELVSSLMHKRTSANIAATMNDVRAQLACPVRHIQLRAPCYHMPGWHFAWHSRHDMCIRCIDSTMCEPVEGAQPSQARQVAVCLDSQRLLVQLNKVNKDIAAQREMVEELLEERRELQLALNEAFAGKTPCVTNHMSTLLPACSLPSARTREQTMLT